MRIYHEGIQNSFVKFAPKYSHAIRIFTTCMDTYMDSDLTKVQCKTCGKWMKNRNILRMHMTKHDKTTYKCDLCGKIKLNIRSLRSHISTVHAIRKHHCTLCDKSFARAINLKVFVYFIHVKA